jgi:S1-C subfamily serine protease
MPSIRVLLPCALLLAALPMWAQEVAPAQSPAMTAQAAHNLLHEIDDAFVSVFQKVAPAVVIIEAERKATEGDQDESFDFFFHTPESGDGSAPPEQHLPDTSTVHSEGSGMIVRPDGYIYTNYHVIEDAQSIDVKLRDNRHFTATLVGADERTDIAVLKIDATGLPAVTMLNSDTVRVGQMCFAIGIPYNLDYSFCRGVVSALGRGNLTATATKPMYEDYIQTDAFINPGNSGGPLFDIDGNVMGMNTLINGVGRGLSFAIPSNMLNDVGQELIANGHASHPWLGVQVTNRDEGPSGSYADQGVSVETIEADTPAYKSDLRPQDIILKVDGVPLASVHDLQKQIFNKKVGATVALTVQRGGRTFDISIVTEKLPDDIDHIAANHYRAKKRSSDSTNYGLEFAPADAGLHSPPGKEHAGDVIITKGSAGGVVIASVTPDSPAGRAGIQPGDILTAVDQKTVSDTSACLALLAAHRGQAGPLLYITRNGHKASTVLDNNGPDSQ